jgi:hypothetical protein
MRIQNLEAPTLAFGVLIRISGDGIEEATIRWRRDVLLALKVFRDGIPRDHGCDGKRRPMLCWMSACRCSFTGLVRFSAMLTVSHRLGPIPSPLDCTIWRWMNANFADGIGDRRFRFS